MQKSDPRWRKHLVGSFTCSQSEDYTGTLSDTLLKGSFAESLGLLITLLEEVVGPCAGRAGPHTWPWHGVDIYLLPTGGDASPHRILCIVRVAERETGRAEVLP